MGEELGGNVWYEVAQWDIKCIGGGRIYYSAGQGYYDKGVKFDDEKVHLFGASAEFGPCDHYLTQKILEEDEEFNSYATKGFTYEHVEKIAPSAEAEAKEERRNPHAK